MGYVVLWIENVAVALLLTAFLTACLGRLSGKWRRRGWGVLALAPIVAFYALLAALDGWFEFGKLLYIGLFWPLVALAIAVGIGMLLIWWRGMRTTQPAGATVASEWPRAKLALALLAAVVLHMMTFANLDAAARQSLAAVRTDAAALAASVAPQPIPDHENAALIYQQAFDAAGSEQEWPKFWRDVEEAISREDMFPPRQDETDAPALPDFKSPELAEFLKNHAGELALYRRAAAIPGCYFDKNYARLSFDTLLPELSPMRHAARLLSADARRLAVAGDIKGALADVNAMFGIASHAGTEPFLVSMLVAAAIDGLACNTLEFVLNQKLPTAEDLSAISIDGATSHRLLFARSLRLEEASVTNLFANMDRISNLQEIPYLFNGDTGYFPYFGPLYRVFLQAHDMEQFRQFLHEGEQLSSDTYEDAVNRSQAMDETFKYGPRGLLTARLTPSVWGAYRAAIRADARHRVAQVALAMFRFRAARSRFPDRIEDLSPEFIAVIPRDPFDGQLLKLAKSPHGWAVYSIGPDLADNHGEPFDDQSKGDFAFTYQEPEKPATP